MDTRTEAISALAGPPAADGLPAAGAGPPGRRPALIVVRALVQLTKPRIIELLLVTTIPTMLLARRGLPGLGLVLVTIGGTLRLQREHAELLPRPTSTR